jgi:hypothetical protein
MKDFSGYEITGANAAALTLLEKAFHELRCYIGDPVATVERTLEAAPECVMAHVLLAYLHLLGTEPAAMPVAREAHRNGTALFATDREKRHLHAIGEVIKGRWRSAARVLEDLSIDYPLDALALQVGQLFDFFTGDSRMLRDRIARALPAWNRSIPGYHAVLGLHAFGLEETGDYRNAELQGRASVDLEPRDGWGHHAVAHVMEMQGRRRDGIAWLRGNAGQWSPESFFAVHNWWHLALFHLGVDEIDEVLALFDGPIFGERPNIVLEMIDASAMLWRLQLRGVDVGNRWVGLADKWEPLAGAGNYAFNDMHAMMAFVGAGRQSAARVVVEAQRAVMDAPGDNAIFTREVGHAATRAILAFGEGDYVQTMQLLRPIRSYAHRFGGSHAQRDLIDLTLIEAAARSGSERLASALIAERTAAKSPAPAGSAIRKARAGISAVA